MKKMFELTSEGDGERSFFVPGKGGKDRILHVGCNDDVLRANAEERKEDGFDVTRSFRRVAHIDLGTVRLLAVTRKDADARVSPASRRGGAGSDDCALSGAFQGLLGRCVG